MNQGGGTKFRSVQVERSKMLLTNYATGQASSLPSTGKKILYSRAAAIFFKYRCYLVVEPVQRYSLFLSLSLSASAVPPAITSATIKTQRLAFSLSLSLVFV
jgi:hypothetical protein